jgi:hypothetical protein
MEWDDKRLTLTSGGTCRTWPRPHLVHLKNCQLLYFGCQWDQRTGVNEQHRIKPSISMKNFRIQPGRFESLIIELPMELQIVYHIPAQGSRMSRAQQLFAIFLSCETLQEMPSRRYASRSKDASRGEHLE